MFDICSSESIPVYAKVLALVIYAGVEAYLGKSEKTKSGSVLELFFNVLKMVFGTKQKE